MTTINQKVNFLISNNLLTKDLRQCIINLQIREGVDKMKLKNLFNQLETEFNEKWSGKRFENINEIHDALREMSKSICEENDLTFTYWTIKKNFNPIIKYKLDFKEDKRYKYTTRGTVNSISFSPCLEVSEDATLEDLMNVIEKKQVKENIERLKQELLEHKQEIADIEKYLKEEEEKLETLK